MEVYTCAPGRHADVGVEGAGGLQSEPSRAPHAFLASAWTAPRVADAANEGGAHSPKSMHVHACPATLDSRPPWSLSNPPCGYLLSSLRRLQGGRGPRCPLTLDGLSSPPRGLAQGHMPTDGEVARATHLIHGVQWQKTNGKNKKRAGRHMMDGGQRPVAKLMAAEGWEVNCPKSPNHIASLPWLFACSGGSRQRVTVSWNPSQFRSACRSHLHVCTWDGGWGGAELRTGSEGIMWVGARRAARDGSAWEAWASLEGAPAATWQTAFWAGGRDVR